MVVDKNLRHFWQKPRAGKLDNCAVPFVPVVLPVLAQANGFLLPRSLVQGMPQFPRCNKDEAG